MVESLGTETNEQRGASKWKARSGTAILSFHSLPLGFFLVSLSPARPRIGECPRGESGRQCLGRPPSGT